MSSSNQKDTAGFLDFLNENDFVEVEKKRKVQIARTKAAEKEQRRIDALPKITDEHVRKAEQEGYERGVQEGIRQGEASAQINFTQHFAELTSKLANLEPQLKKFQTMNQKQAILMCVQTLKTLSESFAEKYPQEVLQLCIQRTFYYAPLEAKLIIRLNPASRFQLEKIENNPLLSEENKSRITFVEDETFKEGDCAIEWDESGIDARFTEASQALQKLLLSTADGVNPSTVELPGLEGEEEPKAQSANAEETIPAENTSETPVGEDIPTPESETTAQ